MAAAPDDRVITPTTVDHVATLGTGQGLSGSEREQNVARARQAQAAAVAKRNQIEDVQARLNGLFAIADKPQERGKLLEQVLNDLFRAYGILVKDDFRRKTPDSSEVLEQIDGVIELDGFIHLVEMKWLKEPVGIAQFAPHLMRLFAPAEARGIFISNSDFTEPVIKECTSALNQKTMFLCSLREIVMLLQRDGDLLRLLREKSRAAIIDKKPFVEIFA